MTNSELISEINSYGFCYVSCFAGKYHFKNHKTGIEIKGRLLEILKLIEE